MVEVHDDATPDDSVEQVVAGFSDPRLRYVRHPDNAGIVGNFTRSLLGASTEYVIQLGDDDIAGPTLVERTVAALDAAPSAGFAHSRFTLIDAAGDSLVAEEDWLGTPSPALEPGLAFVEKSMLHGCRVCSSTAMIRRSRCPRAASCKRTTRRSTSRSGCGCPSTGTSRGSMRCCAATGSTRQSFTSGVGDVTDHGYLQAEKTLREVHAVKRRHAAGCAGPRRTQLERLADRALRQDIVYRVRERTLPDRPFVATSAGWGRGPARAVAPARADTRGSCSPAASSGRGRSSG